MTKAEAIAMLKRIQEPEAWEPQINQAAIKALEQQPCEDTISRQAAIDALARMMPRSYTPDGSHPADEEIFRAQEVFADCIEALEILPSAQPERKRGHWTSDGNCSECGKHAPFWAMATTYYESSFCPNCGADMRGD